MDTRRGHEHKTTIVHEKDSNMKAKDTGPKNCVASDSMFQSNVYEAGLSDKLKLHRVVNVCFSIKYS